MHYQDDSGVFFLEAELKLLLATSYVFPISVLGKAG